MKKSLYLASPLGFFEAGSYYMYRELLPLLLDTGFDIIDPWKLTDEKKIASVSSIENCQKRKRAWQSLNREIALNNAEAIRNCNALCAILDGPDVDSGTSAEIGFAAALGKKVFGYRSDFRRAGDNEGATVNLQVEYFIKMNGGSMAGSLEELVSLLSSFYREEM